MIVARWNLLLVWYSIWSLLIEYMQYMTVSYLSCEKHTNYVGSFFCAWKWKQSKKTRRTFLIFEDPSISRFTIVSPRCAKSMDYKLQYQYIWLCIFLSTISSRIARKGPPRWSETYQSISDWDLETIWMTLLTFIPRDFFDWTGRCAPPVTNSTHLTCIWIRSGDAKKHDVFGRCHVSCLLKLVRPFTISHKNW